MSNIFSCYIKNLKAINIIFRQVKPHNNHVESMYTCLFHDTIKDWNIFAVFFLIISRVIS